ncbi:unnamed protein product, partial [marine sediment metagenome]
AQADLIVHENAARCLDNRTAAEKDTPEESRNKRKKEENKEHTLSQSV